MTLNLEQKQAIIGELTEVAKKSISAAVADYRGLTVTEMTELRSGARKQGIKLRVYRNTLARRALAETEFACLREALVGPIALLFSQDEPGAAARLLTDFTKKFEKLQVRALAIDGKMLGPDQLKAVASLPSRQEALSQLAAVFLAPITQFVRTVNEPVAQFVRVMGQIRDKKQ
ncbi:MAG: 50S ribosomal protein L10 [Coxiella sp. RIFCSPHIGHO2_12_FULL_42_15]|nr:MAG: 50S ribosomal protein L10 [Coxiella sp. RIFCSPHIGHO2_12_FULL_42_15]